MVQVTVASAPPPERWTGTLKLPLASLVEYAVWLNWRTPALSLSTIVSTAVGWVPSTPPAVGLWSESRIVSGPSARVSLTMGMVKLLVDCPGVNVERAGQGAPGPGPAKSAPAAGGGVALPASIV